jgi:hypothetical protein
MISFLLFMAPILRYRVAKCKQLLAYTAVFHDQRCIFVQDAPAAANPRSDPGKEDNDAVRDADAYAAVAGLDLPGWGMTPHPENVVAQFRTDA